MTNPIVRRELWIGVAYPSDYSRFYCREFVAAVAESERARTDDRGTFDGVEPPREYLHRVRERYGARRAALVYVAVRSNGDEFVYAGGIPV